MNRMADDEEQKPGMVDKLKALGMGLKEPRAMVDLAMWGFIMTRVENQLEKALGRNLSKQVFQRMFTETSDGIMLRSATLLQGATAAERKAIQNVTRQLARKAARELGVDASEKLAQTMVKKVSQQMGKVMAKEVAKKAIMSATSGPAAIATFLVGMAGMALDIWDPLGLASTRTQAELDEVYHAFVDGRFEYVDGARTCSHESYTQPQVLGPNGEEVLCPQPGQCYGRYPRNATVQPPPDAECITDRWPVLVVPQLPELNPELPSFIKNVMKLAEHQDVADAEPMQLVHQWCHESQTALWKDPAVEAEYRALYERFLEDEWQKRGRPDIQPAAEPEPGAEQALTERWDNQVAPRLDDARLALLRQFLAHGPDGDSGYKPPSNKSRAARMVGAAAAVAVTVGLFAF